MNIKDKIREADDLLRLEYPIAEWDVTLELRSPSVQTRRDIVSRYTSTNEATGIAEVDLVEMQFALILAMAYEPGATEPLFDEDDMEWLREKNGEVVWGLAEACMKMTGLSTSEDDQPGLEQIEAGKESSSETETSETS